MSTDPRTAMVNVLVTKALAVDEPDWCAGHRDDRANFKVDITHNGPEQLLDFQGEILWTVQLTHAPFATNPDTRALGVYVEQGGYARTLDPAGLDELADALVEQAAALRTRARELADLLTGGGQ
ncbi:DUF6907 domain-containing protein [Streptomyces sp. NPDC055210]